MAELLGFGAIQAISSGVTAAMNAKEAKKARKWSKKMYRRRYQYTMEDMRKAGLNPILAAGMGAGSVPSAAQARLDTPDIGGAMLKGRQATLAKTQKGLATAQTAQSTTQAGVNAAQSAKLASEKAIIDAGLPKAQAEAALWEKIGAGGAAAKAALPFIGGAAGIVGGAKALQRVNRLRQLRKKARGSYGLDTLTPVPRRKK